MKKILVGIIIVVILIGCYFGYKVLAKEKNYYVSIDMNPEIEFILNSKYKVVEVIALDDQADMVIEGLELIGLPLEDATKLVVEDAIKMGYIDEFKVRNRINITTYNSEKINKIIEDKIINKLTPILEEKEISHSFVITKISDGQKELANQKKISDGKMLLVEKAYSLNNSLDKEKLMKLSIKEIQNKINLSVDGRIKGKGGDSEQYHQELKNRKEGKMKQNRNRINNIINDILENNKELLDSLSGVEREEMIKKLINDEKNNMGNRPKSSHGIRN